MPYEIRPTAAVHRVELKVARRPWNPALHPRDSRGRFVETGGIARLWGGGLGRVLRALAGDKVLVERLGPDMQPTGRQERLYANRLTMVSRPDGSAPTASQDKVMAEDSKREQQVESGARGDGIAKPDAGDPRVPVTAHQQDDDGQDIPVEKPTVAETLNSWRSGKVRPLASDPEKPQDAEMRREAARGRADTIGSAQLTESGRHLVGQQDGRWRIYESATGRIHDSEHSSKSEALREAAELENGPIHKQKGWRSYTPQELEEVSAKAGPPSGPAKEQPGAHRENASALQAGDYIAAGNPEKDGAWYTRRILGVERNGDRTTLTWEAHNGGRETFTVVNGGVADGFDVVGRPYPFQQWERDRRDHTPSARIEAEARNNAAPAVHSGRDDRNDHGQGDGGRHQGDEQQDAAGRSSWLDAGQEPERRFASVRDVRYHWDIGADESSADAQQRSKDRDLAGRLAARTSSEQLSTNGRFMVSKSPRGWVVHHSGTGVFPPSGPELPGPVYATKKGALAAANAAEQTRDEQGRLFDWDAPHLRDRMQDPDFLQAYRRAMGRRGAPSPQSQDRVDDGEGRARASYSNDQGEQRDESVRSAGLGVREDVPAGGDGDAGQRAGAGAALRDAGSAGGRSDRESDGGAAGEEAGAGRVPGAGAGEESGRLAGQGDRAGRDGVPAEGAGHGGSGSARRPRVAAGRFRARSQEDLAPSGERAKLRANVAALRTLRRLQVEDRPATEDEKRVLARWSGWGSLPTVLADEPRRGNFKSDDAFGRAVERWQSFAVERAELRTLLDDREWAAAQKNVLNAHYTDQSLVDAVWQAVEALGFDGGNVLEPGSGSGNFIGAAPDGAHMTGVELDPTTAAISRAIYPDAQILTESFARTRAPRGGFDLTVGNVPFGDVKLADPVHNKGRKLSIHDHFIKKSLELTRPGGLVAVVSSRFTLDSEDPAARREMANLGDLVGAVRLPEGAHERAAGTHVVTDVLLFRRRAAGEAPGDQSWVESTPVDVNGHQIPVNRYFQQHPENVLGELTTGRGQFTDHDLTVRGDKDAAPALRTALGRIAADANASGRGFTPHEAGPRERMVLQAATDRQHEGAINARPDGTFTEVVDGVEQPMDVHHSQVAQLRDLLELRNLTTALLDEEAVAGDGETERMRTLRAELNRAYDAYTATYPPLDKPGQNRIFTPDEARVRAKAAGEEKVPDEWKVATALSLFDQDPASAFAYGLDRWNERTKTAKKSEVFEKRVVAPRKLATRADSPDHAVSLAVEHDGELRLSTLARLLGTDEATAREQLGTRVFEDPATGKLLVAADYLSGDVRKKLVIARRELNGGRTELAGHVAALEAVVPRDLAPGEISAKMGVPWIGEDDVAAFLRDILETSHVRVEYAGGSMWAVQGPTTGVASRTTWGTKSRSAAEIAETLLRQKQITVTRKLADGSTVVDDTATKDARDKAKAMAERFADWVWEDPERAKRLAKVYNTRFNNLALRDYANVQLTLPGITAGWKMRDHQNAAIARILAEPAALLAHEVGAGKTATMVAATQELRRTGMAKKPAIVVPNHMLAQFRREYMELYPNAKILVASSADLTGKKRRRFVSRAATGDWDAVILTHNAFTQISMTPENRQAYMDKELTRLREQIAAAKARDGKSLTLKQLENALTKAEEAMKEKLSQESKDSGAVYWEQTGIDYVMVDEAHEFKNLRTVSSIPGAAVAGSQKASDLHMKVEYLRERSETGRVVTFATGTPIANSVTEAFTMLRYLRPDLLEAAGINDFDAWAATFGDVVTDVEVKPDGSGFQEKARFARFRNVPELLRMYRMVADVQTAADLNLPTPRVRRNEEGKRGEIRLVPISAEQKRYIEALPNHPDAKEPGGILKIIGLGKRAAIDPRLVGGSGEEGGKIDHAAREIAAIYQEHKDVVFPTSKDDPTPQDLPGALQLVFMDQGVPGSKAKSGLDEYGNDLPSWNAYEYMRDRLVESGVPREKIRFIHEAGSDKAKAKLFEDARTGKIAVLIGSTTKMGTGTNIQDRAVALHHMDYPWRPADMSQREGRIERQGNLHYLMDKDVRILSWITEETFDAFNAGTLERKAKFIVQMNRRNFDLREMEDIGDTAVSFAVMKALATGNMTVLDHAKAVNARVDLQRADRSWHREQDERRQIIDASTQAVAFLADALPEWRAAAASRVSTRGNDFAMSLPDGTEFSARADAAGPLLERVRGILADKAMKRGDRAELGLIGGHTAYGTVEYDAGGNRVVRVGFDWPAMRTSRMDFRGTYGKENLEGDNAGLGIITSLENRLNELDDQVALGERRLEEAEQEIVKARRGLGGNSPYREALKAADLRVDILANLITAKQKEKEWERRKIQPTEPGYKDYAKAKKYVADLEAQLDAQRPPEDLVEKVVDPDPDVRLDSPDPTPVVSTDLTGHAKVDLPGQRRSPESAHSAVAEQRPAAGAGEAGDGRAHPSTLTDEQIADEMASLEPDLLGDGEPSGEDVARHAVLAGEQARRAEKAKAAGSRGPGGSWEEMQAEQADGEDAGLFGAADLQAAQPTERVVDDFGTPDMFADAEGVADRLKAARLRAGDRYIADDGTVAEVAGTPELIGKNGKGGVRVRTTDGRTLLHRGDHTFRRADDTTPSGSRPEQDAEQRPAEQVPDVVPDSASADVTEPAPEAPAEAEKPEQPFEFGEDLVTPAGTGTFVGATDDGGVLVNINGTYDMHPLGSVHRPGEQPPAEVVKAAADAEEVRNRKLAQAATPEGLKLSYGARLHSLDVEAGHGLVVDGDGRTIGWVRARPDDKGRTAWWGQDARGGAPEDMTWHDQLPAKAGIPPIRSAQNVAQAVDLEPNRHSAESRRWEPGNVWKEVTFTEAQVRELAQLPQPDPEEPIKWRPGVHRRYTMRSDHMRTLREAALLEARSTTSASPAGRRRQAVLGRLADKLAREAYDTDRSKATLPRPGEPDPFAEPYDPDKHTPVAATVPDEVPADVEPPRAAAAPGLPLQEGDQVAARYSETGDQWPGTVLGIEPDGRIRVAPRGYENDPKSHRALSPELVQRHTWPAPPPVPVFPPLQEGDQVAYGLAPKDHLIDAGTMMGVEPDGRIRVADHGRVDDPTKHRLLPPEQVGRHPWQEYLLPKPTAEVRRGGAASDRDGIDTRPVADMSHDQLSDEVDALDTALQEVKDSTDPLALAWRRRAEQRRWEAEKELNRKTEVGAPKSRGEEIQNRLWGLGLRADEGEGRNVRRIEDMPEAKPGAPSDEEWTRINAAAAETEEYPPTAEQELIHEAVARRRLNTAVMALAGTGKSSTLKQLSRRMPDKKIAYLAFNRSVADEAKQAKAKGEYADNVEPQTANGMAFQAVNQRYRDAGRDLGKRLAGDGEGAAKRQTAQTVADLMRVYDWVEYAPGRSLKPSSAAYQARDMVSRWCQSSDAEMGPQHLSLPPWIEEEHRDALFGRLKPIADRMWADILDPNGKLTYDQDYIVKQWALSGYKVDADVIFFDEAQDVNPVLDGVVRGAMEQGVQVVAVGDSNQSIYGFRGATDALARFPVDARLTLTQSFRFGPEIADAGNRFLRLSGTEMRLKGLPSKNSRITELGPDDADAVLCRTNSTAVLEAIDALDRGKRVAVAGGLDEIRKFVEAAQQLRAGEKTNHKDLADFAAWDDVVKYVEEESEAAGSMKTLVQLIENDSDDKLARLLESGGLASDIRVNDDGERLWISGTRYGDPDHEEFTKWLKDAKANGFGKVAWDGESKRWYYQPGTHTVRHRSGKTWTVKNPDGNRDEAQSAILAYLDRNSHAPAEGEGGIVSEHQNPDVVISTAHKSKGLEWRRVRIAGDFRGPEALPNGEYDLDTMPSDEDLRLAYVAVTRATEALDTGSLGWMWDITRGDDPMEAPDTDYRREWTPDDFTVGDKVRYFTDSGETSEAEVVKAGENLTVRRAAGQQERIIPQQVITRNGEQRPPADVASDDELQQAIDSGRYKAPLNDSPAADPVEMTPEPTAEYDGGPVGWGGRLAPRYLYYMRGYPTAVLEQFAQAIRNWQEEHGSLLPPEASENRVARTSLAAVNEKLAERRIRPLPYEKPRPEGVADLERDSEAEGAIGPDADAKSPSDDQVVLDPDQVTADLESISPEVVPEHRDEQPEAEVDSTAAEPVLAEPAQQAEAPSTAGTEAAEQPSADARTAGPATKKPRRKLGGPTPYGKRTREIVAGGWVMPGDEVYLNSGRRLHGEYDFGRVKLAYFDAVENAEMAVVEWTLPDGTVREDRTRSWLLRRADDHGEEVWSQRFGFPADLGVDWVGQHQVTPEEEAMLRERLDRLPEGHANRAHVQAILDRVVALRRQADRDGNQPEEAPPTNAPADGEQSERTDDRVTIDPEQVAADLESIGVETGDRDRADVPAAPERDAADERGGRDEDRSDDASQEQDEQHQEDRQDGEPDQQDQQEEDRDRRDEEERRRRRRRNRRGVDGLDGPDGIDLPGLPAIGFPLPDDPQLLPADGPDLLPFDGTTGGRGRGAAGRVAGSRGIRQAERPVRRRGELYPPQGVVASHWNPEDGGQVANVAGRLAAAAGGDPNNAREWNELHSTARAADPLGQFDANTAHFLAEHDGPEREFLAERAARLRADLDSIGRRAREDYEDRLRRASLQHDDPQAVSDAYYRAGRDADGTKVPGIQGDERYYGEVREAFARAVEQSRADAEQQGIDPQAVENFLRNAAGGPDLHSAQDPVDGARSDAYHSMLARGPEGNREELAGRLEREKRIAAARRELSEGPAPLAPEPAGEPAAAATGESEHLSAVREHLTAGVDVPGSATNRAEAARMGANPTLGVSPGGKVAYWSNDGGRTWEFGDSRTGSSVGPMDANAIEGSREDAAAMAARYEALVDADGRPFPWNSTDPGAGAGWRDAEGRSIGEAVRAARDEHAPIGGYSPAPAAAEDVPLEEEARRALPERLEQVDDALLEARAAVLSEQAAQSGLWDSPELRRIAVELDRRDAERHRAVQVPDGITEAPPVDEAGREAEGRFMDELVGLPAEPESRREMLERLSAERQALRHQYDNEYKPTIKNAVEDYTRGYLVRTESAQKARAARLKQDQEDARAAAEGRPARRVAAGTRIDDPDYILFEASQQVFDKHASDELREWIEYHNGGERPKSFTAYYQDHIAAERRARAQWEDEQDARRAAGGDGREGAAGSVLAEPGGAAGESTSSVPGEEPDGGSRGRAGRPGAGDAVLAEPAPVMAEQGGPEEVAAPEPVGGRPAEWVNVAQLRPGDVARAEGTDGRGNPADRSGWVLSSHPEQVERDGRLIRGHEVTIADRADGASGRRGSVFVPEDGQVARAGQQDGPDADGALLSGAQVEAMTGRLDGAHPTDRDGTGLFPGSLVAGPDGGEGVVTGVTGSTVAVRWDGKRHDKDIAPGMLRVTDGGAARPAGWTADGQHIKPGMVAIDPDNRRPLGVVEDVQDDTVTVTTPEGPTVVDAAFLSLARSEASAEGGPAVAALSPVAAGDLVDGDLVLVDDGGRKTAARIVGAPRRDGDSVLVDYEEVESGAAGQLHADRALVLQRASGADGRSPELAPAEAVVPVDDTRRVTPPRPTEPITGPAVVPQLAPAERERVRGLDLTEADDPQAQQAADRLDAGQPISPEQATALEEALREHAGTDTGEGRTAQRAADRLAEAAGRTPAPAEQRPTPGTAGDVVPGDVVALPQGDGTSTPVVVSESRPGPGGTQVLSIEDAYGLEPEEVVLPAAAPVHQLPAPPAGAKPAAQQVPAAAPVQVRASDLQVGDEISAPLGRGAGLNRHQRLRVVSEPRPAGWWTDMTVVDASGRTHDLSLHANRNVQVYNRGGANPAPQRAKVGEVVEGRARDVVAAVVDAALDGAVPGTIHALRQAVAERMVPEQTRAAERRAAEAAAELLDRLGLDGAQRDHAEQAARHAAVRAREAAVRAVLRTLNDLEPLDGESEQETAERAARLLRRIPEGIDHRSFARAALTRPYRPTGGGAGGRGTASVDGARQARQQATRSVGGFVGQAVGEAFGAAAAALRRGRLDQQQVEQIVQDTVRSMADGQEAVAADIADAAAAADPAPGGSTSLFARIMAALVRLARRVGAWLREVFRKLAEKTWRGEDGQRLERMRERLLRRLPWWPESQEIQQEVTAAVDGVQEAAATVDVTPWLELLPESGRFGRVRRTVQQWQPTATADLAAGQLPPSVEVEEWVPDRAADGGPGPEALRHLAAVRGAGEALDAAVAERIRSIAPELGSDPHGRVRVARNYADVASRRAERIAAEAGAGNAEADLELPGARAEARQAREELQRAQSAYAAALREAARETLAGVREMGPGKDGGLRAEGQELERLRGVEQFLPAQWLAAAGPLTVSAGSGRGSYHPGSAHLTVGASDATALHALAHHLQHSVPELAAAEEMYHWVRTSRGEVGTRVREPQVRLAQQFPGRGHHPRATARQGGWADLFTGSEPGDGRSWEVLPTGLEAMFDGSLWYLDDDLRQFLLGALGVLGRGRP